MSRETTRLLDIVDAVKEKISKVQDIKSAMIHQGIERLSSIARGIHVTGVRDEDVKDVVRTLKRYDKLVNSCISNYVDSIIGIYRGYKRVDIQGYVDVKDFEHIMPSIEALLKCLVIMFADSRKIDNILIELQDIASKLEYYGRLESISDVDKFKRILDSIVNLAIETYREGKMNSLKKELEEVYKRLDGVEKDAMNLIDNIDRMKPVVLKLIDDIDDLNQWVGSTEPIEKFLKEMEAFL